MLKMPCVSVSNTLIYFVWFVIFPMIYSDVYTSSKKIEDMVLEEEKTLKGLHTEISNIGDSTTLSYVTKFYEDRLLKVKGRMADEHLAEILKHPNGVYQNIKEFKDSYQGLRSALGTTPSSKVQQHLTRIATDSDVIGARRSFLRIQEVYSLTPMDMAGGDYMGSRGPSLTALDAFEIGQAAFAEAKHNITISWLDAALKLKKMSHQASSDPPSEGQIIALQGRAHIRLGHDTAASELYEMAAARDPHNGDVHALYNEILSKPPLQLPQSLTDVEANFNRLCAIQNKLTTDKFDRRLKCYYRVAVLPYYRFKQELLSISPYVSLFYDVITDAESQYVKEFVMNKLERGRMNLENGNSAGEGRTSDLSFVWDKDSELFERLSKRVGAITYLNTSQAPSGFPFAGEPFQVVNYGMGGHYGVHMDTFDEIAQKNNAHTVSHTGNRLATFLIYLTEVEQGGATAFPHVDIVVRPVKNMALFWYSSNPAGEIDGRTLHAGCPVVVGHKWVTNKWVWTYGNTFARRCGLKEDATQWDIEKYMRRGWM